METPPPSPVPTPDHLTRVLRARVVKNLTLPRYQGLSFVEAGISAILEGRVEFELATSHYYLPTNRDISLLLAIHKFDRMEWAIEKCHRAWRRSHCARDRTAISTDTSSQLPVPKKIGPLAPPRSSSIRAVPASPLPQSSLNHKR